ncbi:ASCH domain-containing protein [Neorhizobium sp. LMR1-1-1.1]
MTFPSDLPKLALSIRQPWAWAILHAGKPVENRDWRPSNPGLKFRGRVCIHASAGMTRDEYSDARRFIWSLGITDVPILEDLQRGGIVGVTTIVDVVSDLDNPWFFGPRGLVLQDSEAVDFIPVKGALGFFDWRPRSIAPAPLSGADAFQQKGLFDG